MHALLLLVLLTLFLPARGMAQTENGYAEHEELSLFFESEELYVESASRLKENISEAPAVVNIITARQIRLLGARNLMDILITIPGFSEIQDTNEKVVAGRGVFATTTHKFLLLRDGHRLNEPMFEEIVPANAISLASIKRIEVLRGPGASLYGNAALLGVINIITLDSDAPSSASLTAGNFGQTGADFILNEKLDHDRQLLFFAHVQNHDGELVKLPASQDMAANPVAGSQKVESRPFNFDVGMTYKGSDTQISFSARRAAYDTPRSNDGALLSTNDTLITPIQVFDFQHLDIQFLPTWNDIDFTLRHYADRSFLRTPQYVTTARDAAPLSGKAFDLRIETVRAGIEYSGQMTHDDGTLIVGMQLENFWLLDSVVTTSFTDQTTMVRKPGLANVSEWNSALYVQEKYNITPDLILNAGLRWDYYKSFGSSLNPRLALVYNPLDRLYLKFIYGRAFQAPSYFYRTENQGLGYGSPTGLQPEKLDNFQLSVENSFGESTWLRITAFHNQVKDLIARPGTPTYQNLDRLTTRGIESELKIKPVESIEILASHTLLWAVNSKTDAKLLAGGKLKNIPRHTVSAGITWDYAPSLSGSLYTNWHGSIASPVVGPTPAQSDPAHTIPAAALVHLTLNADNIFAGMQAQLSVHNLLNKRDWRGGTTKTPYPQEGRSFLLTLGYQF